MEVEQKVIEVVGGIICRGDKFLLGKRPVGKSQGGHWEFIGGKIELGETPCEALARECREEIALEIVNARVRTAVTHAYPDRTIHLTLIDCEPAPAPTSVMDFCDWFPLDVWWISTNEHPTCLAKVSIKL